jgi:hypothetical protein
MVDAAVAGTAVNQAADFVKEIQKLLSPDL